MKAHLQHASSRRPQLAWLLACAACAPSATSAPVSNASAGGEEVANATPTPALPVREDLPVEAHEVLASRMMRHGDQMSAMMLAVVLLDYEVVRLLTSKMISEPLLGRPAAGDEHSLNGMLPASFFVHQDQMLAATRTLAAAAAQTDDLKLVAAFNDVSRSCVGCHSAYLHEALVDEADLTEPCDVPDGSCDDGDEPGDGAQDSFHDL
jgi:Cytochrome C'